MRPVGFSTGALAYSDFRRAIGVMHSHADLQAIELSALRACELKPLVHAIDSLDLSDFPYISVHIPSKFDTISEVEAWRIIAARIPREWPLVVHPDAITEWTLWRQFGSQLCIENMDKRKPLGRSARELDTVFKKVPEASLCFDIGHARQFDPTMTESFIILREFGDKLRQIHLSEVDTCSKHDRLSYGTTIACQQVAHLIPNHLPLVLETPLNEHEIPIEVERARLALPLAQGQSELTARYLGAEPTCAAR